MKIGEKLRKIRDLYGYKQEYIATHINLSISQYCKYERDETPITLEMLGKVCAIYNLSQLDFLKWDENTCFNSPENNNPIKHKGQPVNTDGEISNKLFAQMQEEIVYLKSENQKLWDLVEKLK